MANAASRATVFSLHMLAYFSLRILHLFYSMLVAFSSSSIFAQRTPQSLTAKRKQIPSHLAVLLVSDDDLDMNTIEDIFIETVDNAVQWCRIVGIPTLTVYDSEGILVKRSQDIRQRVKLSHDSTADGQSSDSDIVYPLTPPPSDHSDSVSFSEAEFSPSVEDLNVVTIEIAQSSRRRTARRKSVQKRRRPQRNNSPTLANPLTLHIASRESSKPAVASVARSLAVAHNLRAPTNKFNLTINDLHSLLEGERGLPAPDFMIVHPISPSKYNQTPLEIHGFPPWQIRLTEFYHNTYRKRHPAWMNWLYLTSQDSGTCVPLDQLEFRTALDEFATAEKRLGK